MDALRHELAAVGGGVASSHVTLAAILQLLTSLNGTLCPPVSLSCPAPACPPALPCPGPVECPSLALDFGDMEALIRRVLESRSDLWYREVLVSLAVSYVPPALAGIISTVGSLLPPTGRVVALLLAGVIHAPTAVIYLLGFGGRQVVDKLQRLKHSLLSLWRPWWAAAPAGPVPVVVAQAPQVPNQNPEATGCFIM